MRSWWRWAGGGFRAGIWAVPCRIVEVHVAVDSLEDDSPTGTGGVLEQGEFAVTPTAFQRLSLDLRVACGRFDFFWRDV